MSGTCCIAYSQINIIAALINYSCCAGILFQFYIYFVIDNVDSLSDSVQRSNGIAGSVLGYFRAVACQTEYRICCYVSTDSQQ